MTLCTYGKTLLKVDHVSVSYQGRPVLKDVCAEIQEIDREGSRGQVVGFLGPSGIGKSTLFRVMAGLEQPTSGRVEINGFDRPVRAGEVGVVAQNYPLFEHRTVYSNLLLAANMKKLKDPESAVSQYLAEFSLAEQAHSYPTQLSGGQKQRVSICQQILCSDHFLLMDEPFSGLDLLMLEKTAALIQKVANLDALNSVVVVSHDVTSVCSIADHVWMLGRDRDAQGNPIHGASIKEVYNLVDRDLCWHADITRDPRFVSFVLEVKERFRTL